MIENGQPYNRKFPSGNDDFEELSIFYLSLLLSGILLIFLTVQLN